MNLTKLKTQITNKQFDNIYYFTGDDWKLISIYAHQIAKASNKKIQYIDSIKEIIFNIRQGSIVANHYCYVVYEDKEYLTNEKAWNTLNSLIQNDIVIFVYHELDKRSKFYKQFKDVLTEFCHMTDEILIKHIQHAIPLSKENCVSLINICEHDYGKILLEIDKIKHFPHFNQYDKAYRELIMRKIIVEPPKDAIFELVDAIILEAPEAIELYNECKKAGENNLAILQNLFTKARAILQVKSFLGNGDICQITGLKSGMVWGCKKLAPWCTVRKLKRIMKLTQHVEEAIKVGKIPEEIAIDYILVNTLRYKEEYV